ncbi:hypothetical protein JAAARDRAFT_178362 [Jaapia argillacea MUCL 33604]|uniref:snRNA-activating protein complex subunit 3 n=1 Tax=Jaapia argillacea MUCL 33604 TaxID=933084 RepID=A0A067Q5H5_9AGAM|nr:hypothetical protein JAAARDRAFT_178362 [Jaapia argillacea MUCL 33604]
MGSHARRSTKCGRARVQGSVQDIKSGLVNTLNNPTLAAHILKHHDTLVSTIHESADSSNKRRKKHFPDPSLERPEIYQLRNAIENIQLKCWPLYLDSALFMRAPKNSDLNTLIEVKKTQSAESPLRSSDDALITISVYNRLTWGPGYVSRASQHAVLSSQTLGDLVESIPCPSLELPNEVTGDDGMVRFEISEYPEPPSGCVVCIEGLAYGDGLNELDYADRLLASIDKIPEEKRPSLAKGPSMHDTLFSSLALRLNEPYWLLHQGSCEHFLVVDQIRLLHPSDPPSGYPLALQITPPLLDFCRACTKVPAVWSIVGDVRLGESPCVLCGPCWRSMGIPQDEGVVVVPLPKYEHGW